MTDHTTNATGPVPPWRAVLLDVSRGRVPRLSSLLEFVDLIAGLDYNQLFFNIEHTFRCSKHPQISQGHGPITPAEFRELDRRCQERKVELIPFQQSLGHMRHAVSNDKYRSLAYDRELSWSLDPGKEGTYELLADLYDAQIEVTSSDRFHVGCDEPFDIIRKFDPDRFGGRSIGAVIRDHLARLHGILKERGKTMMAWADAAVAHPEILSDLPDDLILCHWSYGSGNLEGPEHYRPGLELIADAGLTFYACTCTWSLMKIFPDLRVMRANHDGLISEARRLGAQGMMITIWGDMGHMNLPGLETYPLAYGARHGKEDETSQDADQDETGHQGKLAREIDTVNRVLNGPAGMGGVGFLLFFAEPLDTSFSDATVKDYEEAAEELRQAVDRARLLLAEMEERDAPRRSLWLDYHLPLLQMELLAKKLSLAADLRSGWPPAASSRAEKVMATYSAHCREIARLAADCLALLESRWLSGSKEAGLEVNRRRYRRLIKAWRARADEFGSYAESIKNGGRPPDLERVVRNSPSGYVFNALEEMGLLGLL